MDPRDISNFIALTLVIGVAAIGVGLINRSTRADVTGKALPLIALAAAGATAGSLYFSEHAGYIPCELCWFQRIGMYPMAIIMPLAAWKRDHSALRYSLALSVFGAAVSAYHIQLQLFPDQGSFCELSSPCTVEWVKAFGWMTIPQMAGLTFVFIAVMSVAGLRQMDHRDGTDPQPAAS